MMMLLAPYSTRRQFLARVAGAAGALAAASGCAQRQPDQGAPLAPARLEPATIRVMWGVGPIQEAMARDFEAKVPQIKVELEAPGDIVYGNEKYLANVAAGIAPDVAYQNTHTFWQFASRGLYRAIDDLVTRDRIKKDDFPPLQIQQLSWEGKLYGMRFLMDGRYFFWNRQHLEEAGLNPDKGPETWSDIEQMTARLTRRSGGVIERFGFIPGFPPGLADQLLIFGLENGARTLDREGRKVLLDSDEWVEALEWVVRIHDQYAGGYETTVQFLQGFQGQQRDAFAQGRLAMCSYGSWMIQNWAEFPDPDFSGTYAMPVAPRLRGQKVNWTCGFSFVLDPNSKKVDQGWEFAKFATGIDGMRSLANVSVQQRRERWAQLGLRGEPVFVPSPAAYRPAREWLYTEYVTRLPPRLRTMAESVFEGITWAQSCGMLGGLAAVEMWKAFRDAWTQAVTKQASPKNALYQARQEAQKALDEAWTYARK